MSEISQETPLSLVKTPLSNESQPTSVVLNKVGNRQPLGVGGMEGAKHRIQLLHPKDDNRTISYVTKEFPLESLQEVEENNRAFGILRSLGYPVPGTTRHSIENGQLLQIMTDMTEAEKYQVWGWSNNMTEIQQQELLEMNLTPDDIAHASTLCQQLAQKATQDGLCLMLQYYHLRKDLQTEAVDIVLLDVDKRVYEPPSYYDIKVENPVDAEYFIRRLEGASGVRRDKTLVQ